MVKNWQHWGEGNQTGPADLVPGELLQQFVASLKSRDEQNPLWQGRRSLIVYAGEVTNELLMFTVRRASNSKHIAQLRQMQDIVLNIRMQMRSC